MNVPDDQSKAIQPGQIVYLKPGERIEYMSTPTVEEKVKALNTVGQEIHENITFKDGLLSCQLQIGHPNEEGNIKGCFPTHLIDFVIELHQHYNSVLPSRETSLVITKLQEARLWLEQRKLDREKRGVLQTDDK